MDAITTNSALIDSFDAECGVAGALLIDGDSFRAVEGIVSADDFRFPLCRAVFEAASALALENGRIDARTIVARCDADVDRQVLAKLIETTPTAANAPEYAKLVADHSRRRRACEIAQSILDDATSPTDTLIAQANGEFEALTQKASGGRLITTNESIIDFLDSLSSPQQTVRTGYKKLDSKLGGGLLRGGLYLVAARPGMGKTSFALNLAERIKGNVLFVSLEMPHKQLMAKRIARITGINSSRLTLGDDFSDAEWDKIADATQTLSSSGLTVNRRDCNSVSEIGVCARGIKKLQAIFVDYIGLLRADGAGSRYETVSDNSAALKRLAVSLNVPIIALAQLNREAERRDNKRPQLADLRDSGSLEQDADAVLLLYRADYYANGDADEQKPSPLEVDIAKNRHAGRGQIGFDAYLPVNRIFEARY